MIHPTAARCLVAVVSALLIGPGAGGAPQETAPPPAQLAPDEAMDLARQKLDAGELTPQSRSDALELVRAVLDRDPGNIKAKLLGGELLLEAGPQTDFTAARKWFGDVLGLEPLNFRANLGLGKVWHASRYWRQAAQYLEKAEQVAPQDKRAEVKRLLASVYAGMGDTGRALAKARESVEADPRDLDSREALVDVLLTAGARDPQYLEQALTAADTYVAAAEGALNEAPAERKHAERLERAYQYRLGTLRAFLTSLYERDVHDQPTDRLRPGRQADAAATLARMAESTRRHAAVRTLLADHDAVVLLERAVQYEPDNLRHLEALAAAYERTRNGEGLVEACRRILQIDPNHAQARKVLGIVEPSAATQPAATQPDATPPDDADAAEPPPEE